MKKKKNISKFVDIEAGESESSECESSDFISEDMGPGKNLVYSDSSEDISQESGVEEDSTNKIEVEEEVGQHSLLPSRSSPKLWLLRVNPQKEKLIVHKLSDKPQILSAFCKEELTGYIYVEAMTNQKIVDALEDIRNVNKRRITLIPLPEMIEVFSENTPNIEVSKFYRIRSGKYKDDLAQILEVGNSEMARVRIIPRINDNKELFDHSKVTCVKSRGYYIYKKDCYKDGFLEKEIMIKNLQPAGDLSFLEMELFKISKPILKISDKIKVRSGELRNVLGTIKNVTENDVVINTQYGEQIIAQDVLQKHFEVGEDVSFKGENGVIVDIQNDNCVVLFGMVREMKLKLNQLEQAMFEIRTNATPGAKPRFRRDPMLNKTVTIKRGEYKGYKGIVKDVYRNDCSVQLITNLLHVTAQKDELEIESNLSYFIPESYIEPGRAYDSMDGSKTPGYKTPGYKTPGYKTPGYKTPGYKTPGDVISRNKQEGSNYIKGKSESGSKLIGEGAMIIVNGNTLRIKTITDNRYVTNGGEYSRHDIEVVKPSKYDKACVIEGSDIGKVGIVISDTNEIGVLKLSDTGSIISVSFDSLTKIL